LYQFSFASNPLSALVPRAAYAKNNVFEAALLCPWAVGSELAHKIGHFLDRINRINRIIF
jgi:hypothetical protein